MSLAEILNHVPLLRPLGVPANVRRILLVALKDDLGSITQFLSQNSNLEITGLLVADISPEIAAKLRVEVSGKKIPCLNFNELADYPEYEKVFLSPENPVTAAAFLSQIAIFASSQGIQNIYLAGEKAPAGSLRAPQPDFMKRHENALKAALGLFKDHFSKETFIGRIKAILTGNAGYIPIASHVEYFHPLVSPQSGDVMVDGGVSDMVDSQRQMLEAVGPDGEIYGFEPIPDMALKAAAQLAAWPHYHLEAMGLAGESGKAFFTNLRDSSYMDNTAAQKENAVECALTSIDEFWAAHHLSRLDCIKLDVEGAEMAALQGASNCIRKFRPKLIICVYHKPVDIFEIPLYLKKLVPEYQFYLAHSSCKFTDTILYASCTRKK